MPSILSINLAHVHLVMNHVPTVGAVVALGMLIVGYTRRNDGIKHLGLEVLFLIAVLTVPVYMTGVAAHATLKDVPEVSDPAILIHEEAALFGFTVLEFAGFVAWAALWQGRRRGRPAPGLVPAATVLLLLSLAIMGRAASLGGEIRHPEIVAAGAAVEAPPPTTTSKINQIMVYSTWVWPAAEAVHFLGLCLSIGVLLAVNLRILGVMPRVPFADLHRLLPWGMLGFGANLITGMLFFIGQPGQYLASAPFYWKVVFLMVAGGNFLYLTVFTHGWAPAGEEDSHRFAAGLADKAMAVTSIAAWLAVLYAGRMLPFLGKAF